MEKSVSLINNLNSNTRYLTYDAVEQCPICKAKIRPVHLAASLNTSDTASVITATKLLSLNIKCCVKTPKAVITP